MQKLSGKSILAISTQKEDLNKRKKHQDNTESYTHLRQDS